MNRNPLPFVLGLLVLLVVAFAAVFVFFSRPEGRNVTISQVVNDVKKGDVVKISYHPDDGVVVTILYRDGQKASTSREPNKSVAEYLLSQGVPQDKLPAIEVLEPSLSSSLLAAVGLLLGAGLIFALGFGLGRASGDSKQRG